MRRIPILGYTQHYNTKKQNPRNETWRLGGFLIFAPKVGINMDIWLGYHILAFWWHPTRKYGRGRP